MERPYIISWNLTYRCNLACEHCYLDAGGRPKVDSESFSDRSELNTEQCFAIIDQIADFAPECVTILTGGEPLLRRDILEIIEYGAAKKLWVVVGTNGVKISAQLAERLKDKGVRGMALSLDALDPERHDRFRMVRGAWENTVQGAKILHAAGLPFIIQTTVAEHNAGELAAIAKFAHGELSAKVWNLYFLVQTGRGAFVSDLTDGEYERVLAELAELQERYQGRMMVNAKCAPHFVRYLFETNRDSPFLKRFTEGAGGCPAGSHYMGIRPNGDMTPCPYLPVFGGNLRESTFAQIWNDSETFRRIRGRNELGGRCGACEFKSLCGGCRARAFGVTAAAGTADFMAEDPLCSYEPGKYSPAEVEGVEPAVQYGEEVRSEIVWEDEARARIARIPAFVRGMVVRKVEEYCRQQKISVITGQELERIRSRIPTQKLFG